jgi:hypothetical protein
VLLPFGWPCVRCACVSESMCHCYCYFGTFGMASNVKINLVLVGDFVMADEEN